MLKKLFGFEKGTHNVRTEIMAGVTTFLTMAYILAVQPSIMEETGMDKGAVFTSTVLISAFATMLMALYAKLPFAIAPGMGPTAFFAYTVCIAMGYSWQFALTAVLLEGLFFILLTISNLREKILESIPEGIKNAIGAGIGLFIAFIGLKSSGVIVQSAGTLVELGDVTSGSALLCLIGVLITSVLIVRNVSGALLIGIVATTLIGIPLGITKIGGLFDIPPSISPIFCKFDFSQVFSKDMIMIVFIFLFVNIFDTIGTLIGVASHANMYDEKGQLPWIKKAFAVDAISSTVGAMMGSSTTSTFVESAAGIQQGGRTGLTSFTTATCFLIAIFLAPFFMAVPAAATAPVMIIIGVMMMNSFKKVDLQDYSESIPAFVCVIFMPLTYSISNGIIFGVISYVVINALGNKWHKVNTGSWVLAILFILKFIL
ncbi:MAG: NCS2 family permease [Bacteroidaceae bacterium]|nr:NCS2 family permease [Bacteroidaceae bacterium]MBQ8542287.1 NCS2 family permease [Bacteroidaceae bacterium]